MVERRKRPTSASQYCGVRGTDSLLYQREHSAMRWDGALELGVNYVFKPPTVPFTSPLTLRFSPSRPEAAKQIFTPFWALRVKFSPSNTRSIQIFLTRTPRFPPPSHHLRPRNSRAGHAITIDTWTHTTHTARRTARTLPTPPVPQQRLERSKLIRCALGPRVQTCAMC